MNRPGDAEQPRTVVVTGAAGWLGQNLVRALAGRERVRCLVPAAKAAALLEVVASAVEVVPGDVRDPSALDRLFEGVSDATVFHAAAVIHPRRRVRELFDVNVGGTEIVLDRARRAGSRRFVHVSSNSPFGANETPEERFTEDSEFNPYLAYGESKLEAEQVVMRGHERGDVAAVIVRPPWFYGPFQAERQTRWMAAVRRGRFPLVGAGMNRRSMVFTGNLVHAMLRAEVAAAAPGNAYWIADAEPYAMAEVVSTVRDAFAAEGFAVTRRTPRLPRAAGTVAAFLDARLQERGVYVQPLHVLGELEDTIACDISRARDELGYQPETSLFDGMRVSIRWCVERGIAL